MEMNHVLKYLHIKVECGMMYAIVGGVELQWVSVE